MSLDSNHLFNDQHQNYYVVYFLGLVFFVNFGLLNYFLDFSHCQ